MGAPIDYNTIYNGIDIAVSPMHVPIKVSGHTFSALLDTGALSANYINKNTFDLLKHDLTKRHIHGQVYLADGATKQDITCEVTMKITIILPITGGKLTNDINFQVLDTPHAMVFGAPDLLDSLFPLLIETLRKQHQKLLTKRVSVDQRESAKQILDMGSYCFEEDIELSDNETDAEETIDQHDLMALFSIPYKHPSLKEPFTTPTSTAPEEAHCPSPANFEYATHFSSISRAEAIAEYEDLYKTQVHESLWDHKAIIEDKEVDIKAILDTIGSEVFVPTNWDGIKDVLIDLQFDEEMPTMKAKTRHINEKIFKTTEKEFKRLQNIGMYVPSTSHCACAIVVAPKATDPYIRLCGDYVPLNKHIKALQYPIPVILQELQKLQGFKYFTDVDMTNAFHQCRLSEHTSNMLSIVCPWGQFRPVFMPEGIGPATALLQKHVREIFEDFKAWSVIIFDNFLLLANTYDQLLERLYMFLTRCKERNVFLKFKKSYIGFTHANFFGYKVQHGTYELQAKHTNAIRQVSFPDNIKAMRTFLGSAIFFKTFVPHFATMAAPLHDMVKKDFNWSKETWKEDYKAVFECLIKHLAAATTLHYPDYTLDWTLQVDASNIGVGGVLFQTIYDDKQTLQTPINQPLAYVSQKFSSQASRWSTIEQEAYAIYYAVLRLRFYLKGKPFILQTDHRNLQWIESSESSKIIRWRILLNEFVFRVMHIPGHTNHTADLLSRNFNNLMAAKDSMLQKVHGARTGHRGVKRTMDMLNRYAPGHKITLREVREYVESCGLCQLNTPLRTPSVPTIPKTLRAEDARHALASDVAEIGIDKLGNRYIIVIYNIFTKYLGLYPTPTKSAESIATAYFIYMATYGVTKYIRTDPGSEYTSHIFQHLNSWLGVLHSPTMVDNPQADGAEPMVREVKRHLIILCTEEAIRDTWSNPTTIATVQLIINNTISSESGTTAYEATFGRVDCLLPRFSNEATASVGYVQALRQQVDFIQRVSAQFQADTKAQRTSTASTPAHYSPGDLVTKTLRHKLDKETRLHCRSTGPYEVDHHVPNSNQVHIRDLVTGAITPVHVQTLVRFKHHQREGTPLEAATALARKNAQQSIIDKILGHKGNPLQRTTCDFLVRFADQEERWLPYHKDIYDTAAFEAYCRTTNMLSNLLLTTAEVTKRKQATNQRAITIVQPPLDIYGNIRDLIGEDRYTNTKLPDKYTKLYFFRGRLTSHTRKLCKLHVYNKIYKVDNFMVNCSYYYTTLPDDVLELSQEAIKNINLP